MYSQFLKYPHVEPHYQAKVRQIGFVAEKYLRYLPREIPEFPSHGPDHSINIIELIDNFVVNWDADLSEDEIFLLYVAAWTHDIGCLINRKNHQNHSIEILDRIGMIEELLDKEMYRCLKSVVKYHSSNEKLNECPPKWGHINLQKICAIFRILDASDITEIKCPKGVYEILVSANPPLSKEADEFWNAHMNIESVQFEHPKIKIYVDDYNKCKLVIQRLEDEIKKDVEKILIANNVTCPVVDVCSDKIN